MHKFLLALVLSTAAASAQTTGVPFVNDLAIRLPPTYVPQGSGTTSCNNLGFVPGAPFPVFYDVTAVGSTAVVLMLGFVGCTPAGIPFLPSQPVGCAGPPAGTPLTNLWFSVNFGGGSPFPVPGIMSSAGMARWNFTVPPGPASMWAQAVLLDPCSSWGFKFTQALGFSW
ncbi:MAG: hypothetical protein IT458_16470 [Planctomycetes bacterium]|nr:hypothetical protein [Planctomycetota bacterium]